MAGARLEKTRWPGIYRRGDPGKAAAGPSSANAASVHASTHSGRGGGLEGDSVSRHENWLESR